MRVVFTSATARRQTLAWLVAFGALLVLGTLAVDRWAPWRTEPAVLRARIDATGPLAPAVFVLVQATQVIIAPIPGQVLGVVSGYLFGTVHGTLYSLLGTTIGSYVVFRLSRRYGREQVERAIKPELVAQFDAVVEQRGLLALFVVFLVPGLPDDVICFVAGLTTLRIRDMVVVAFVGRFPGFLVANAAGAQFEAGHHLGAVALVTLLAVLSALGYVYRDELLRRLSDASHQGDGQERGPESECAGRPDE
jgi:uncharacterized membrane protein YdjX (TVP38/TMEM64 family)